MRSGGVDRLFGLRRVGKIDAAELDFGFHRRHLRRRVIHAGYPSAPRKRRLRDHLAERARGAGHDNDFSIHDRSPGPRGGTEPTLPPGEIDLQCCNSAPQCRRSLPSKRRFTCPTRPRVATFLTGSFASNSSFGTWCRALKDQRKIKIVAIGSSLTAGEGDVVPYPYRLEL